MNEINYFFKALPTGTSRSSQQHADLPCMVLLAQVLVSLSQTAQFLIPQWSSKQTTVNRFLLIH